MCMTLCLLFIGKGNIYTVYNYVQLLTKPESVGRVSLTGIGTKFNVRARDFLKNSLSSVLEHVLSSVAFHQVAALYKTIQP